MRQTLLLLVSLAVVVGIAGCGMAQATGKTAADADAGNSAAALVMARCTTCHPADRIDAASHDAAGWTATVTRMQGHGANVTEAEKTQIVDYLAKRSAG